MKTNFFTLLFFFGLLTLACCSTVYYVGETTEPMTLYLTPSTTATSIVTVPLTKKVLIKKRAKTFPYAVYETYQGYAYKPTFANYHKFNSLTDGDLYGYSTIKRKSYSGSSTSSGGPIQVKGYYRKNGTYVSPHTRSAPSRRH